MRYVFVYGTLRRGHGNHRLLKSANFIGEAYVYGTMAALGGIPAVIELGGKNKVRGEVYGVNDDELKELDRLEGYYGQGSDNFYNRVSVGPFFDKSNPPRRECYMYTMKRQKDRTYNIVEHGDWNEFVKER